VRFQRRQRARGAGDALTDGDADAFGAKIKAKSVPLIMRAPLRQAWSEYQCQSV
jgi:hypothetical protein